MAAAGIGGGPERREDAVEEGPEGGQTGADYPEPLLNRGPGHRADGGISAVCDLVGIECEDAENGGDANTTEGVSSRRSERK